VQAGAAATGLSEAAAAAGPRTMVWMSSAESNPRTAAAAPADSPRALQRRRIRITRRTAQGYNAKPQAERCSGSWRSISVAPTAGRACRTSAGALRLHVATGSISGPGRQAECQWNGGGAARGRAARRRPAAARSSDAAAAAGPDGAA
jgi:hypothetical protein